MGTVTVLITAVSMWQNATLQVKRTLFDQHVTERTNKSKLVARCFQHTFYIHLRKTTKHYCCLLHIWHIGIWESISNKLERYTPNSAGLWGTDREGVGRRKQSGERQKGHLFNSNYCLFFFLFHLTKRSQWDTILITINSGWWAHLSLW